MEKKNNDVPKKQNYGQRKYISYPFLYDEDSVVEYEMLTDQVTSQLGVVISLLDEDHELKKEIMKLQDLVYHSNPCIRTKTKLEDEEIEWMLERKMFHHEINKDRETLFVMPGGCTSASYMHVVRSKGKQIVRLMYKIVQEGFEVDSQLFDFANIFSNYAFELAMRLNKIENIKETPYKSRVYK